MAFFTGILPRRDQNSGFSISPFEKETHVEKETPFEKEPLEKETYPVTGCPNN